MKKKKPHFLNITSNLLTNITNILTNTHTWSIHLVYPLFLYYCYFKVKV